MEVFNIDKKEVKRLNPLDDFVFQKLMGNSENKDGLISFLNAVLSKTRKEKIEDVEIIENKQLAKKLILDKTGRLDVRARLEDNTEIDIEVQK